MSATSKTGRSAEIQGHSGNSADSSWLQSLLLAKKVLIVGYGLADCEWDYGKGEYKALSQFAVCCARALCAVFHLLLPSVCDFISFLLCCRPALHAVVLLALGGCLDEHLSIGRPGPRQQSLGDPLEPPPEEPR